MIRAFIFDLDGTLVDTLGEIAEVMNDILQERHWPAYPTSAYRAMVGKGLRALIQSAVPKDAAYNQEELYAQTLERFEKRGAGTSVPYPGTAETLRDLDRNGIPLAVLSNKPDPVTRLVVAQLFPNIPFAFVRGGIDGMPIKPHPSSALDALASMRAVVDKDYYSGISDSFLLGPLGSLMPQASDRPPEQLRAGDCALVGDSDVDIKTAQNAGMMAVGAAWGFRGEEELHAAGARYVFKSIREILRLI